MNCIGINVSKGKSNGTLITDNFEKITFKFKHNKSGFKDLSKYNLQSQDTIVFVKEYLNRLTFKSRLFINAINF